MCKAWSLTQQAAALGSGPWMGLPAAGIAVQKAQEGRSFSAVPALLFRKDVSVSLVTQCLSAEMHVGLYVVGLSFTFKIAFCLFLLFSGQVEVCEPSA